MKKILIVGKRGFIGNNLSKYLKKFYKVKHKSFKDTIKEKFKINNYDYVINTSINQNYVKKKYNRKFDNDFRISNSINKSNITYVFLSTRKIYKSKANIRESSKLLPRSNYSKNKLITERVLKKKLGRNLVILRISNIIGDKSNVKNIHNTFIDVFFDNLKKGFIVDNKKDFKDFISIDKFCQIIRRIIIKELRGIFNVSIGRKVYLNDLLKWLIKFNNQKYLIKKKDIKDDCFYLNNKKLMSKIKIKNSLLELRSYCHKISKKSFS